jgi:hypothetical protein
MRCIGCRRRPCRVHGRIHSGRPGAFPDHPTIYFGRVRRGYAWSFPNPTRQLLGIAALKTQGRRLQDDFRRFLRELRLPDPDSLRLRRWLLPEMRYAWAGRQIIFALPPRLYHPLLGLFLRLAPKMGDQTIQGQRSFRWFRFKTPSPH